MIFLHPLLSSTRGHDYKVAHSGTQLEIWKRFLNLRCVDQWIALPAELVGCENTETFKHGLALHHGDLLFHYLRNCFCGTARHLHIVAHDALSGQFLLLVLITHEIAYLGWCISSVCVYASCCYPPSNS